VRVNFEGGTLSSDGGVVLLGEVERRRQIIGRFADCFVDHRDAEVIEHPVADLVAQRVYGLALGYEDVNDHDELRADPLLATVVGKSDPTGSRRRCERDRGKPLAGKSTLNRLEGGIGADPSRHDYKRVGVNEQAVERLFVEVFLEAYQEPPEEVVLDLDATHDPLHGKQEGRFFHGFYGCYCYLPLYIFSGQHLLCAKLRRSNIDASAGALDEVKRIVAQIRQRWPEVKIILRGDSGFARDPLMTWAERHGVHYVFGLARNARLERAIEQELVEAERRSQHSGTAERIFKNFSYETLKSWSRSRRVVGKAEHIPGRRNPRFVVTSLSSEELPASALYEDLYCARGDMENRVKEQQLALFANRMSAHLMAVNQLRLWLSSVAYTLMAELRRLGLKGTTLARAQCGTIRVKLLKIGAQVRVTCRRVWVKLSSAYPHKAAFLQAFDQLHRPRGSPA
jgi:hypothetical protein